MQLWLLVFGTLLATGEALRRPEDTHFDLLRRVGPQHVQLIFKSLFVAASHQNVGFAVLSWLFLPLLTDLQHHFLCRPVRVLSFQSVPLLLAEENVSAERLFGLAVARASSCLNSMLRAPRKQERLRSLRAGTFCQMLIFVVSRFAKTILDPTRRSLLDRCGITAAITISIISLCTGLLRGLLGF